MNIVVDASAFLAIYLEEPEAEAYETSILVAENRSMSPVNYWESMIRASGLLGAAGVAEADALIKSLGIRIEPVTEAQGHAAVEVFGRFGKGHPARLNMGDCFAYALSKTVGAPLLFKGQDFPRTDIAAALLAP